MNAETDEALGGLRMLLKELETNSLIDSSDAERVRAAILCLEAAERRAEKLLPLLREAREALAYGVDSDAVHEALLARLDAALAPQAGGREQTPPEAQGREEARRRRVEDDAMQSEVYQDDE